MSERGATIGGGNGEGDPLSAVVEGTGPGTCATPPAAARREVFSALVGGLSAAMLLGCSTGADGAPSEYVDALPQELGTDVNTIAGLRALAAPTSGNPSHIVLGASAVGDGGGGVFVWVVLPSSPPADDGGNVITPSGYSGNGRWLRQTLGSVPSISALRALPAPSGGAPFQTVMGFSAPGDGGGGTFVWKIFTTTPPPADDGGTIVVPAAYSGSGRWQRVHQGQLDVRWFGAKGDGVTADQVAINAAIGSLKARSGGTLLFPPGTYLCTAAINLDQCGAITLQGQNGARLVYGASSGSLIQARSSARIKIKGFTLGPSAAYSGNLVDFGHFNPSAPADTGYASVEACSFTSPDFASPILGTTYAHSYIRLAGAICSRVVDCDFTFGEVAIVGLDPEYSNAMDIDHCTFMQQTVAAIKNAGEAWRISNCTFEPSKSGAAAAYRYDSTSLANGVAFSGCWFGDAGTGDWIVIAGYGISINGCMFYGSSGTAITINAGEGISIAGNGFWAGTGIKFPSSGSYVVGVHVAGNTFQSSNPIANQGYGLGSYVGNYGLANFFSYGMTAGALESTLTDWGTHVGYLSSLPVNKIAAALAFLDGATGYPHCSLGLLPSSSTATNAEVILFGRNGAGVLQDMARFGPAGIGFFGHAPTVKPTVTGSRSAGTALASLLTALASLGLITDSTSA